MPTSKVPLIGVRSGPSTARVSTLMVWNGLRIIFLHGWMDGYGYVLTLNGCGQTEADFDRDYSKFFTLISPRMRTCGPMVILRVVR